MLFNSYEFISLINYKIDLFVINSVKKYYLNDFRYQRY